MVNASTHASCRPRRFVLAGLAVLACACDRRHQETPVNPGHRHQIYDMAWRRGQNDRLTPLPNNWQRYEAKLEPFADVPDRGHIFSTGYDDGFNQHPEEQRDDAEMDYDSGYRSGEEDAWQRKPSVLPTEPNHAKGYGDGFNHRPHAYGRPY